MIASAHQVYFLANVTNVNGDSDKQVTTVTCNNFTTFSQNQQNTVF